MGSKSSKDSTRDEDTISVESTSDTATTHVSTLQLSTFKSTEIDQPNMLNWYTIILRTLVIIIGALHFIFFFYRLVDLLVYKMRVEGLVLLGLYTCSWVIENAEEILLPFYFLSHGILSILLLYVVSANTATVLLLWILTLWTLAAYSTFSRVHIIVTFSGNYSVQKDVVQSGIFLITFYFMSTVPILLYYCHLNNLFLLHSERRYRSNRILNREILVKRLDRFSQIIHATSWGGKVQANGLMRKLQAEHRALSEPTNEEIEFDFDEALHAFNHVHGVSLKLFKTVEPDVVEDAEESEEVEHYLRDEYRNNAKPCPRSWCSCLRNHKPRKVHPEKKSKLRYGRRGMATPGSETEESEETDSILTIDMFSTNIITPAGITKRRGLKAREERGLPGNKYEVKGELKGKAAKLVTAMCCPNGTPPSSLATVELTSTKFGQEVTRLDFGQISSKDLSTFENILGKQGLFQDPQTLPCFNVDCYGMFKGQSKLVLVPQSTLQVSKILLYCNSRNLAVTPQGGNTGLVGGSVPVFDEIILSTNGLRTILGFDETTGILRSQAGVTLRLLNEHVAQFGYVVPLDLAPDEFCQIGGNVATNAGGLRFFRYGSLHTNVAGLEVVLANGDVLDTMSCFKKDNTGYDLKQILIGSEGTLGIITQVAIQCHRKPTKTGCVLMGVKKFEEVLEIFESAHHYFGEALTCAEVMDDEAMACVNEHTENPYPFSGNGRCEYYVVLEISSRDSSVPMATTIQTYLDQHIPEVMRVLGDNQQETEKIWALRRSIGMALICDGYAFKYDFSIPLSKFPEIMTAVRRRVGVKAKRSVCFGHLGDSNIHVVVTVAEYSSEVNDLLEPFVYDWVHSVRGSVSAEHGIGFKERKYLSYSKSPEAIAVMKRIKGAFDPKGILNPYKIFM